MFKKQFRLPVKSYNPTTIQMRSVKIPLFILRFSPNGLSHNRYGFIVSKRVDKSAVGRNRAKRVFRANIEQLSEQLQRGYDMLFVIRQQIKKSEGQINEHVVSLFKREKLFI